ncbi:hypothetical protein [Phenylobacterium soli]|uniref:Uncharacterized protein n=1 Tax=Phenylobacterium soli TaxID=2170551 RepID=A0A328AKV9_9CAUL|nr:hypothetical protein [Phenylobacterium soli]RAK55249.1 hypothetical protein DJ017_12335 [Phenylobacterium soli]
MFRRALIAVAALGLATASPAHAEGPKPVGQYVDLQPVGLPVVVKGQLVNYVFVYVRVNLTASADVSQVRTKEPFFRDALVRLAHRTPFTRPDDYNRIDERRVAAAMTQAAAAITGPGIVASAAVTSQAPQHRIPNPKS